MTLHVALYQPEIPPNTGNIIRLCANTGAQLHLIHPLGFTMDDKRMRRAGLDYHEWASVQHYRNFNDFTQTHQSRRMFACSTKACTNYTNVCFQDEDCLLFGPETKGLPKSILDNYSSLRIAMSPTSRSLNLSNAVAIVLFEAWRQLNFSQSLI